MVQCHSAASLEMRDMASQSQRRGQRHASRMNGHKVSKPMQTDSRTTVGLAVERIGATSSRCNSDLTHETSHWIEMEQAPGTEHESWWKMYPSTIRIPPKAVQHPTPLIDVLQEKMQDMLTAIRKWPN